MINGNANKDLSERNKSKLIYCIVYINIKKTDILHAYYYRKKMFSNYFTGYNACTHKNMIALALRVTLVIRFKFIYGCDRGVAKI